jgi:predicted DNA-binding protein
MEKEKRVLCVKMDPEDVEKIEQIAKSRGLDKSKLIRELIETYLLKKREIEAITRELDKLVEEAREKMNVVYGKWVKYCEDFAREIVVRYPQYKEITVKNECLKDKRGLIIMDLQIIAREYTTKIKNIPNVDIELKREYYKKIWGLIDTFLIG